MDEECIGMALRCVALFGWCFLCLWMLYLGVERGIEVVRFWILLFSESRELVLVVVSFKTHAGCLKCCSDLTSRDFCFRLIVQIKSLSVARSRKDMRFLPCWSIPNNSSPSTQPFNSLTSSSKYRKWKYSQLAICNKIYLLDFCGVSEWTTDRPTEWRTGWIAWGIRFRCRSQGGNIFIFDNKDASLLIWGDEEEYFLCCPFVTPCPFLGGWGVDGEDFGLSIGWNAAFKTGGFAVWEVFVVYLWEVGADLRFKRQGRHSDSHIHGICMEEMLCCTSRALIFSELEGSSFNISMSSTPMRFCCTSHQYFKICEFQASANQTTPLPSAELQRPNHDQQTAKSRTFLHIRYVLK